MWEEEECSDWRLYLNYPFIHGSEGSLSPSFLEVVAVGAPSAVNLAGAQILIISLSGAGDPLVL